MSSPHHRHQASLEGVLDFSPQPSLTDAERAQARDAFYRIVRHFERIDDDAQAGATVAAISRSSSSRGRGRTYSQPRLIRCTYEFALLDTSRDIFLRAFFETMALPLGGNEQLDFAELEPLFRGFAEYLMDHFFLPLKASTAQTPQPSPAYHSAVIRAQGAGPQAFGGIPGTPERLSALRGTCLVRDRFRCVISRSFDSDECTKRYEEHGDDARDEDGVLFSQQQLSLASLEVAHILPHALTKPNASGDLDKSREAALAILNMFDNGVTHLINGVDIDRPRNALSLAHGFHRQFGAFKIYFDAVPGQSNTYQVQSFLPGPVTAAFNLPVVRTLFDTENHTIDMPSPRLLAVHRAIAHILHLSGAGEYIDRVLRDMEDNNVRSDGSTELGRMVTLGLGRWRDNTVF
ncbi:hypothetical protein SPI_09320 [Niveomyces insectorum RCEF 264]|uniref:HNH nuclease domain-containing protein n=1 Tax=Niveomyces insectorum RCEF 264 TaxID=1081102 RepID=A0A167LWT1_9HYPO|nr:hypothetical protein SPI_09320 [Niveomyces insectorum RCEF 264]